MKKIRRPLLVLHCDRRLHERIREAAGKEYHFQAVPDWKTLRESICKAPPAALLVVDPYLERNGGLGPSPALRGLIAEFPSLAVVAAMEVTPARFDDLRTLGSWGVVQVISLAHDDTPYAIGQRLKAARGRPLRALLERALPAETSGRARGIVDAAVDVVAVGGAGRDLAKALHLSRRTLLRWCTRAGLPTPRVLLAWMRILLAAELLDDPGRSVLRVALVCGYSSDSGLRRITQRFLGSSPTELRRQGAFAVASAAFVEFLRTTGKEQ